MYDLILPIGAQGILTEPRSEQAGNQAGKYSACSACVNDTYPDFFRDPSLPWSNLIRSAGFSMRQRPSANLQLHSYVPWEDEPPFSSPFGACTSVLFFWIFIIHYFRLRRAFTLYQMSWISATMAVVPRLSRYVPISRIGTHFQSFYSVRPRASPMWLEPPTEFHTMSPLYYRIFAGPAWCSYFWHSFSIWSGILALLASHGPLHIIIGDPLRFGVDAESAKRLIRAPISLLGGTLWL